MNLPIYHHMNFKSGSLDELNSVLGRDLNFKHPVVLNLKHLNLDQQREFVGLIENYFVSSNLSYKFPYPVYILTDHESSISGMTLLREASELPRFFAQKEAKMNVKEGHLASKNKLLQQEIKNCDSMANQNEFHLYAKSHKKIFELEQEGDFYRGILKGLMKGSKNG